MGFASQARTSTDLSLPTPEVEAPTAEVPQVAGNQAALEQMAGGAQQSNAAFDPGAVTEAPWWGEDECASMTDGPIVSRGAAGGGSRGFGESVMSGPLALGRSDLENAIADATSASPTLAGRVAQLRGAGWSFVLGPAGAGTSTNFNAKLITFAAENLTDLAFFPSILAHEVGHAQAGEASYEFDTSMTRQEYIHTNTIIDLKGEALATVAELEAREEIVAKDPARDPGITGATAPAKIRYWEAFRGGFISRAVLIDSIVALFATQEKPSTDANAANYYDLYAQVHAKAWDKTHPPAP